MTSIVDLLAQTETDRSVDDWKQLRNLLSRGGEPRTSDAKQLAAIVDRLELDLDVVRACHVALQQAADLERAASENSAELENAIRAAGDAMNAYGEETKRIKSERADEQSRLHGDYSRLQSRQQTARKAARDLETLKKHHWRLFGEPEPQAHGEAKSISFQTYPDALPVPLQAKPPQRPTIDCDSGSRIRTSDNCIFEGPARRESAERHCRNWTPPESAAEPEAVIVSE